MDMRVDGSWGWERERRGLYRRERGRVRALQREDMVSEW